ncbi:MAG: TadE/TadG family type IV pilus assembly protein [Sphingomicrobium sp.]
MIIRLPRLLREERGSVTIELAFVAPVLALVIAGVSDVSIAYGRELELEQAAQRSIEKVMQTTGAETAAATIQKEAVCQINGANDDGTCKSGRISTDNVTVTYSLKCNGAAVSYSSDCTAGQTEVRYIQTVVTDTYRPVFARSFGTASDGTYHLRATAGVRVQ